MKRRPAEGVMPQINPFLFDFLCRDVYVFCTNNALSSQLMDIKTALLQFQEAGCLIGKVMRIFGNNKSHFRMVTRSVFFERE